MTDSMKRFVFAFLLILIFGVFCARANPSWQAYLLEDGDICVTDGECEGEPISELTLGKGESSCVEVRGVSEVSYYTSGYYCAHVDEEGMLVTEGTGSVKIRVYYAGSSYVEFRVEVKKAPAEVKLNRNAAELKPGDELSLTWSLGKKCAGRVTFYSSNESVASVTSEGLITALAPGEAEIRCESYNGKSDVCRLTVVYPAPAKVLLAAEKTGYACETLCLDCELSGGYMETVSYESSDNTVCAVDENGTVTCLKEGFADITARASGGNSAVCRVTVKPAASGIYHENGVMYLYGGGRGEAQCITLGGSGNFSCVSLDPEIAAVEADGRILALKPGTARIQAVCPGGAQTVFELKVLTYPRELKPRLSNSTPAAGETARLELYTDITVLMPVEFSSSDESVLTIDETGLVTARSPGNANIIITTGGAETLYSVTVERLASEITFGCESIEMGTGDSYILSARHINGGGAVTYVSSNPDTVKAEGGTLTALKPGTAKIEASLINGVSASLNVYVYPAAMGIYPDKSEVTLCEGDSVRLTCGFDAGTRAVLSWSSSDEVLLKADPDGVITSLGGKGSACVTASASSGANAVITVTVVAAPEKLSLSAAELSSSGLFTHYLSLAAGESVSLNPDFGAETEVSFSCESFDPDIALVSPEGTVTGTAPGCARIQVTSYNGITAEVLVEVTK